MAWFLLIAAIVSEVGAPLSLLMATHGSKRWYVLVVVGYLVALTCSALTLQADMGIWVSVGAAQTDVTSLLLFKEPLNRVMAFRIIPFLGDVQLVGTGEAY